MLSVLVVSSDIVRNAHNGMYGKTFSHFCLNNDSRSQFTLCYINVITITIIYYLCLFFVNHVQVGIIYVRK